MSIRMRRQSVSLRDTDPGRLSCVQTNGEFRIMAAFIAKTSKNRRSDRHGDRLEFGVSVRFRDCPNLVRVYVDIALQYSEAG